MTTAQHTPLERNNYCRDEPQRVAAVGSPRNNNDNPHFEYRLNRKRPYFGNDSIQLFVAEAIQSHRAVVFSKDHKSDPLCNFIHKLFSTNCSSSEIAFYHLDEIPQIGDRIQDYLARNYDSTTSEKCFVFVRGKHVPFRIIQSILAGCDESDQKC